MAISERQLETWSHQGSKTQSAYTYASIKSALEDRSAPFANRNFEVYLQGSYGNDTNVYAEGDVDIVICLTSSHYKDISILPPNERAAYEADINLVNYGFRYFQRQVLDWLIIKFGTSVRLKKKAIFVPGNSGRRDADVLVCVEYRKYISYRPRQIFYHSGICFQTTDDRWIINFPKQHKANCTAKHQAISGRFKPNVRIFKNLRNAMVDKQILSKDTAPSYFIEGMLWNVPNVKFLLTYQRTLFDCLFWLRRCDPSTLKCVNNIHPLIRDDMAECWNMKDFRHFLEIADLYRSFRT